MAATTSPPEQLRKPNERHAAWLLRRVWDRVNRKNQHFMLCIVGEEGSGKSWTAMRIADAVDPTFTADRVIFDVVDLLKILAEGRHEPGNFYVLDEAGVQLGRRSWQQRSQILANQALQIIRDENLGLVFTVPTLGDLDSQTQRRLQAFYELTEKQDGEFVRGKFKIMDPDRADETGKIYKKYPKRVIDGQPRRLTDLAFTPPDPDLIEPYTERKEAFQQEHYRETIAELTDDDSSADSEATHEAVQVFEKIMGDGGPEEYLRTANNGREYIDADLIEVDYELSARQAKKVKKLLVREHGEGEG